MLSLWTCVSMKKSVYVRAIRLLNKATDFCETWYELHELQPHICQFPVTCITNVADVRTCKMGRTIERLNMSTVLK
jgi:hypothetical protein